MPDSMKPWINKRTGRTARQPGRLRSKEVKAEGLMDGRSRFENEKNIRNIQALKRFQRLNRGLFLWMNEYLKRIRKSLSSFQRCSHYIREFLSLHPGTSLITSGNSSPYIWAFISLHPGILLTSRHSSLYIRAFLSIHLGIPLFTSGLCLSTSGHSSPYIRAFLSLHPGFVSLYPGIPLLTS